jgi:hypothetical protein
MIMADGKTGRQYMYTSFANSGRKAGMGILHDDYSEKSGNPNYEKHGMVRFPHDNVKPEELNGPVICYKGGGAK